MKVEFFNVWGQFYIWPTVKITPTLQLYGHYSIEFLWLNRGMSLDWGHQK
jgi:hypothetical protein